MLMLSSGPPLPAALSHGLVAIGNFDGVHRGHQALLTQARTEAQRRQIPFLVLTFDPHPRRFFAPDAPPFLLTPPDLRAERLALSGADALIVLPFDAALAALSPEDFIVRILSDFLQASGVAAAAGFRFGHGRAGTVHSLQAAGFFVLTPDLASDESGQIISSTRIRTLLSHGDIAAANALLGWPFEIRGTVQHGDKRGRTLGYPTANLGLETLLVPAHGVYAALVADRDGPTPDRWHPAAVNLGIRPMFETPAPLLEAHLLDFSENLYGHRLRVRLLKRLREERRFSGLPELAAQIGADCAAVRDVIAHPA